MVPSMREDVSTAVPAVVPDQTVAKRLTCLGCAGVPARSHDGGDR